ncbi:MAG: xanthine dehydrogenase family protein subunit M [Actinomycetota bacterium]|nr:xanthine dehydrogenase family protein subunit M [Actinomycetota bacterium]
MKPPSFDYAAPETLDEVLDLLQRVGDDAVVIAGGQSLVPMLNLRLARPELVIDIRRITELATFEISEKGLLAGAMTRVLEIEEHPDVDQVPGLRAAICQIAHPQIRSRSTIGGSVAHADPAAELPALLVALDGSIVLRSMARGERTVSADDFFSGPMMTAREPDELVGSVSFPAHPGQVAVLEVAKRPGDFATVGVVVGYAIGDGVISSPSITAFGVGGRPVRMTSAEEALRGAIPCSESFQEAAELVRGEIAPQADAHASSEYRRQVTTTLVERALVSLS